MVRNGGWIGDFPQNYQVQIRDTNNIILETLFDADRDNAPDNWDWTKHTYDITAYIGQTIRLFFNLPIYYQPLDIRIDDIAIVKVPNLDIKLSGEFDYTEDEPIRMQIAALVTERDTQLPVTGADVKIAIYDPNGALVFGSPSPMVGNGDTSGVYLWKSPTTLADSGLPEGIYLVYVTASNIGFQTVAIMEFHIQAPAPCDCTCPSPPPTTASFFPDVLRILPLAVLAGPWWSCAGDGNRHPQTKEPAVRAGFLFFLPFPTFRTSPLSMVLLFLNKWTKYF